MPDREDVETRLRRTFRWIAGDVEHGERSHSPAADRHVIEADADGSFIDDRPTSRRKPSKRRTVVLVAATILLLAAIGTSIGLVVSGPGPSGDRSANASKSHDSQAGRVSSAEARRRVVSALGATTAAGNWDISYSYSEVAGTGTATTTTTDPVSCPTPQASNVLCVSAEVAQPPANVTVTGTGTIDVSPKAMVTEADPSNFGEVILRINSSTVWELGSNDGGGLAPSPTAALEAGPGNSLSGFSGLVEGTLGTREGAIAMLGIGSPTGYLELDEESISSVAATGQGTVNDKPVTQYRVSTDPTQLAKDPSESSEEVKTIGEALSTLQSQGLTTTTTDISVDAQGFIVQSTSTYRFSDGGSVTVEATFSNFGCAGTVLMPGQAGSSSPPANCVSSDNPQSSTTTSGPSSTTSSTAPAAPPTSTTTSSDPTSTVTAPSTIPAATAVTTTTITVPPPTTTSSLGP
jgi:hypothetical protein